MRPVGQILGTTHELDGAAEGTFPQLDVSGVPVSAVLDGLPVQNHQALSGHLVVDDPDGVEENYPVNCRCHGTAMASVIIHGDLSDPEPIQRPLYVRPILEPHWANNEAVSENELVVDLVHRAVRRIKEGDRTAAAVAPEVCIINFSIGDAGRPFHSALSPLARLLDWLAWRYDVLFIVSAGNHREKLTLETTKGEFLALEGNEQRAAVIQAVARQQRLRRLLSPGETVNGLCVGAANSDLSDGILPPAHLDPFGACLLPSAISAVGLGYRRGVKPDLLAPGGRCPLEPVASEDGGTDLHPYLGILAPGVQVASPSTRPGETNRTVFFRGTSVACAFATHWATKFHDVVVDLRRDHADTIDRIPRALWIKTLLVHSTAWAEAYAIVETTLKDGSKANKMRENGARFLGYGALRPKRGFACSPERATALASGLISADEKRTHSFPLPPVLSGKREWKRLTITLSWFTPINPLHQAWRRADLWFETKADPLKVLRNGVDHNAVRRGTVQHEIYEGSQAAVFVDGDNLLIEVNCRPAAGSLEVPVPYALAVSLEVEDGSKIPIYDEVRVRIRPRVRVDAVT